MMTTKKLLLCAGMALFLFATPKQAWAIDEALALQVSRVGDVELSCGQLSQEAVLMRDIVMTTQDIKDNSDIKNKGITAMGAVGSFFIGSVTGGVGLAAAGYLLKDATEDVAEKADGVQDIAEQRRSLMLGIYNAKGCLGPMDHAMLDKPVQSISAADAAATLAAIEPAAGQHIETATTESSYNP